MNSIEFDISSMLQNEKENFQENENHYHYKKYAKTIGKLCTLIKKQMVKEKSFLKNREETPDWFDVKKKNYKLEKADNVKFQKFPEPDYFTTQTEYYEYKCGCPPLSVYSTNDSYTILLALAIKQSKLEDIYDLLELHRENFYGDFDELMYNLDHEFSCLFSQETKIVLYNWGRGVPKNHPKIFKKVEEWKNGTMVSMYAFEKKELEEFDKSMPKEMSDLLAYMALPIRSESQQMDYLEENDVAIPPIEMDKEKVSFEIEMKSIFITEERNWGSRKKYTKKQLEHLQNLIGIVQDFLCKNGIILQSKKDDLQYFWNNKRTWEKGTKQRRKEKMFPELEYFISGNNIYYYFDEYSHIFESNNNPNFQLFFAFRLRQILLEDIDAFLDEKRREFKGDFFKFLQIVLVEYDCLFSKKTKKMVSSWKQKLVPKLKQPKPQITTKIIYVNEVPERKTVSNPLVEKKEEESSFLETLFQEPPKGYIQIEGKLKEPQIKKFLSFLYLENNGSKDGLPFLSENDVKKAFKYGLAYPEKEPEMKPFSLNLNKSKRIKGIIGLMFYHLYVKNEPRAPSKDYKNQYAKLLRSLFDNFTESEASTRYLLRSTIPTRLDKKKFNYQQYILDLEKK